MAANVVFVVIFKLSKSNMIRLNKVIILSKLSQQKLLNGGNKLKGLLSNNGFIWRIMFTEHNYIMVYSAVSIIAITNMVLLVC